MGASVDSLQKCSNQRNGLERLVRRRRCLPAVVLVLCGICLPIPSRIVEGKEPKNFVFFLVDDLGWADIGCFGSTFYETPNIDALRESGMKFSNAYAACPVCSPTRASIMTGRHPVRLNITDWIPGARAAPESNPRFLHVEDRSNLSLEEVTIAEILQSRRNYQTFFAGKWHLGDRGHWPEDQGFDWNIGGNSKGSPPGGYYAPWKNPTLTAATDDEYLTERLTDESVRFLEQRDSERPFLLYLSYYNVHTPITAYQEHIEHFRKKADARFDDRTPEILERRGVSRGRQDNPALASMIAAVDDSVGVLLGKLDQLGIRDDTVVIFFSDNGGLCTTRRVGPTCNLPLRSGKGWLYEGGIREPMLVSAPGITGPGTTCDTPVVSMDFFPTMLKLAGLDLAPELHADGRDLGPLLGGEAFQEIRPFFWHYPHYHGSTWTPGAAVRFGKWKLIEFYEFDQVELYDLEADVGEQDDLADRYPEKVGELRRLLADWQASMGAQMPRPNPNYRSAN